MDNIKMIQIEKIHPHINNPRKDLGDLTELAESIKANGIFQNLTVVPQSNGEYTVIIGHRRLAAAKLAGLTEMPCAVKTMPQKEQIATMLAENMQRNDLTVYEQAQGIQMMLDLGDSVSDISRKTGFSETTIRRRTAILKLPEAEFKEAAMKGGTLFEYEAISRLEDENTRTKMLKLMGDAKFSSALKTELENEKNMKAFAAVENQIKQFATKRDYGNMPNATRYVCGWGCSGGEYVNPEINPEVEYYYIAYPYTSISIYRSLTAVEREETNEKQIRENRKQEKIRQLQSITNVMAARRKKFIENLELDDETKTYILRLVLHKAFGCELAYTQTMSADEIFRIIANEGIIGKFAANKCFDWAGEYRQNDELNRLYEDLESLGYEISDEEEQILNGTHKGMNTKRGGGKCDTKEKLMPA